MEGAPVGARVMNVGVCMETDPIFGIVKQLNLQFVLAYAAEELAESLRHLAEGRIGVGALITGLSVRMVAGAFAELANPARHAKVMIEPWH